MVENLLEPSQLGAFEVDSGILGLGGILLLQLLDFVFDVLDHFVHDSEFFFFGLSQFDQSVDLLLVVVLVQFDVLALHLLLLLVLFCFGPDEIEQLLVVLLHFRLVCLDVHDVAVVVDVLVVAALQQTLLHHLQHLQSLLHLLQLLQEVLLLDLVVSLAHHELHLKRLHLRLLDLLEFLEFLLQHFCFQAKLFLDVL